MGFMSAYKHLDTICRDMNGVGVSGYIEDMERYRNGIMKVQGWDSDYRQLKHYRWVRNQIAHEMNAEEENMCTPEDTEWLENFYQRIMERSDPLARYAAIRRAAAAQPRPSRPSQSKQIPAREVKPPKDNRARGHFDLFLAILLIATVLVVWYVTMGT